MNPDRRKDFIDVSVDVTQYELNISENAVSWEIAEYADMHTSDLPPYRGPTEFVPTQQPQHVYVGGKTVRSDILIQPIPENYGLITYDGATLTVS